MKNGSPPLEWFWLFAIACLLLVVPVSRAQQPNAWQINDNTTISGVVQYVTNLTTAQVAAAKANGWHYSLLSRILADTSSPASHSMAFGDGTHRFYVYFDLDTSGKLTAQLVSSSNVTYTLGVPAPDISKYHLHELAYDPVSALATYKFDGTNVASWSGDLSTSQSNQVMWGANSSNGQGEMNYHHAEFAINGQGTIATYEAGFDGNPATTSPTNQGWKRVSSGVPLPEAALSPDSEFVHPVVLTSNAIVGHPGQATLAASVNPNGWPAYCYFEYGPTANYGSVTPSVAVGSGTSYAAATSLLTGLPRGVGYHFRAIASNSVGNVIGGDMRFTVLDTVSDTPVFTEATGGGQPVDLRQPSLEVNFIICTNGNYPESGSRFVPPFLGEVRLFAGSFAPAGWALCQGQLLDVSNYLALHSVFYSTYGGNGGTNFALPDFRARTIVHPGEGQGLSKWYAGQIQGYAQVTLSPFELASHTHALPRPYNSTGVTGNSARRNGQPSLGLTCLFALQGQFPNPTQPIYEPFVAQMPFFAGDYAGSGLTSPSGQALAVAQNTALFSVIGTNYGGDGQSTFDLPDLQGRTPLGNGQGSGLSAGSLGQKNGNEFVLMSVAQLPSHQHSVSLGFQTGFAGSNQPQSLLKPTLVLQYLIATNGEIPSISIQATNKMIGEIQLFAGTNVPGGWTPCNGQSLSVGGYPALFGVISNFYGGDGVTTFALPDLDSRIPVGTTNGHPGATYGSEQFVLTLAQMPPHTHSVPAPDFDRWITSFGLTGANAAFDADADGDGVANGFEWATGSDPTDASSFAALKINSAADFVNVQFPRNTNATDVTYSLERTTDLQNPNAWTGLVTNLAGVWNPSLAVSETGMTNPVSVSVTDPRTNHPAADYRLKLEWP